MVRGPGSGRSAAPRGRLARRLVDGERFEVTFGGVDLPARLTSLLTPAGRFADRSAFVDHGNALAQSLAVIALHRTGAGAPTAAVDLLAGAQCADGGFPLEFGAATCVSDTDATAFVVQALPAGASTRARWPIGARSPTTPAVSPPPWPRAAPRIRSWVSAVRAWRRSPRQGRRRSAAGATAAATVAPGPRDGR